MPALRMLNRRWSIATDDVPVLSLFPTLFHGVWTVALGVGWIVLGRPGPYLPTCRLNMSNVNLSCTWCYALLSKAAVS